MNPKVSIIAPVHNVEKYIRKCIESVVAQTYTNWEFLLVNDCSPDNSQKIIDEYVAKDNRIKSFRTSEPLCSGGARNLGLKNATGEYIMFVDSDDWILPETLEECLNHFKDEEIESVLFGDRRIYEDKTDVNAVHYNFREGKFTFDGTNIHLLPRTPWGKMFKYEKIKNIKFLEKAPMSQDVPFCLGYFWGKLPTVYYIRKPFYQYIIRETSASGNSTH